MNSANTIAEDNRKEYESLRKEIEYSDNTCVKLIHYLFLITAPTVAYLIKDINTNQVQNMAEVHRILSQPVVPFLAVTLSVIWYLGFWYLSEKRFVIKKAGIYIHYFHESEKRRFGWESFRHLLKRECIERPVFWNPYYLETIICSIVIFAIPPLLGWKILYSPTEINPWGFWVLSFFFTTGWAVLFLFDALKSYKSYRIFRIDCMEKFLNI